MTYREIIAEVAGNTGLSKTLVEKIYRGYWRAVREHITSLPLKEDLTDEEFMELQPNVNIPSLGKLYVNLERYQRVKKRYKEYLKLKQNKDVTCDEDKANL